MPQIASELFLLTSSLSQLKNRDTIVQLFIESICVLFPENKFKWETEIGEGTSLPVCTRTKTYGHIHYKKGFRLRHHEFSLFQNAIQLVAFLLERLEQEELLKDQKAHLQYLIDDQTAYLIEKQDELNEMNEEFVTLNEELVDTNQSLLKLNEQLQEEIERRKKLEDTLAESVTHFRTLADSGQALIWTSGLDKKCNYFNQPWLNFTGRKLEQELGDGWTEGVHPDDFDFCVKTYINAFDRQEKFSMDYRVMHHTGEYRWIQDDGTPRFNSRGEFLGYIGHCLDITERKNIEEALKENEERFRTIVYSSPNGIYFYQLTSNDELIFSGSNPAADKIIGVDHQILLGKTIQEAFPNLANTDVPDRYTKIAKGEIGTINFEIDYTDQQLHGYFQVTAYRSSFNTVVVEFSDVSERRNAEQALHEKDILLNLMGNMAKVGGWEVDCKTMQQKWTEEVYRIHELDLTYNPNVDNGLSFYAPGSKEIISVAMQRAVEYGESFDLELEFITSKGNPRWVHSIGRVIQKKGKTVKLFGSFQDITERKQVEIQLRESERLLTESQRVSKIGSYTLFIEKGIWIGSVVLNEMFELAPADDHSVAGWLAVIHPEDREMMSTYFASDVIGKKGRFDKVYRVLTIKRKKTIWVHGIGELEFDRNGNPIKMIGTIQDITYRVYAEEKLRILSRAIDQSPDSIVITNSKGTIEYVNPVIEKLSGYSKDELIGKNPRIFSSGKTPKEEYKILWDRITSGHNWQGEFQNKKKNGELYWESATISPVFNNEGKITHYLAIREDITTQKRLNRELVEAKEHAEESDRLKSSFLANMSHEIRTPMNSIMGFASLLPEEDSKELMSQYAQIIVRNSEQLVHIIDDIVLYSRLQTRLLSFYPSQFEVNTLFIDIIQSFNLPDFKKGVELVVDEQSESDVIIKSDYEKLRQVITNLISNAFKYTLNGTISVGVKRLDNQLMFSVKDTGMGIPENEIDKIFDRFYRASNVNKGSISGTGLGLSIVKELIDILGGRIWVEINQESKNGDNGSAFYFTIPNL